MTERCDFPTEFRVVYDVNSDSFKFFVGAEDAAGGYQESFEIFNVTEASNTARWLTYEIFDPLEGRWDADEEEGDEGDEGDEWEDLV